jgi:hypothetical protein
MVSPAKGYGRRIGCLWSLFHQHQHMSVATPKRRTMARILRRPPDGRKRQPSRPGSRRGPQAKGAPRRASGLRRNVVEVGTPAIRLVERIYRLAMQVGESCHPSRRAGRDAKEASRVHGCAGAAWEHHNQHRRSALIVNDAPATPDSSVALWRTISRRTTKAHGGRAHSSLPPRKGAFLLASLAACSGGHVPRPTYERAFARLPLCESAAVPQAWNR